MRNAERVQGSAALQQKTVAPGLQYALTMAQYQVEKEKEIRRLRAADKEVSSWLDENLISTENWFYAAIALALHRLHGWGGKRVVKVLETAQQIYFDNNYEDEIPLPERLWQMCRDEIGLDFKQMMEGETETE